MVRMKSRYLLCKAMFNKLANVAPHEILAAIKDSITAVHGQHACSCISPTLTVKYMNCKTTLIMLKVAHAYYRILWSSLPFVSSLRVKSTGIIEKCILQTVYCGATIRSVQKFIIKYDRKAIQTIKMNTEVKSQKKKKKKKKIKT